MTDPKTLAPNAAQYAHDLASLNRSLAACCDGMADTLGAYRKARGAALRQAVANTNRVVHNGFRMIADAMRFKTADLRDCGDDPAAIAEVNRIWHGITRDVHTLRVSLMRWPGVQAVVQAQVRAARRPLEFDDGDVPDTLRRQLKLYDEIFDDLRRILNAGDQDSTSRDNGYFADIGLPHSRFMAAMHAAYRLRTVLDPHAPTRFLDVGCGGGLKVYSAAKVFAYADGIEFDPGYAASARALLAQSDDGESTILETDALSFEDYDTYDVIYFYRPIRNDDLLIVLEDRIAQLAQPGALLIAPYRHFETRAEELGCQRLCYDVFIKGPDADAAHKLRREAETIGPDIDRGKFANIATVWDRVVEVSRRNGFAVDP